MIHVLILKIINNSPKFYYTKYRTPHYSTQLLPNDLAANEKFFYSLLIYDVDLRVDSCVCTSICQLFFKRLSLPKILLHHYVTLLHYTNTHDFVSHLSSPNFIFLINNSNFHIL